MKADSQKNKEQSDLSHSTTKVCVRKKGQKYGDGYVNEDGQRVKAQGFRFFGFFNKDDHKDPKNQHNSKQIHNLRPQRFQQNLRKRRLGFISGKQIFGNNKKGQQWINQQRKRRQGGDIYDNKKQTQDKQFNEDQQVIYIEASVAEKRLQQLKKIGRTFYDEKFPPNQYSLSGPYGYIKQWDPIKWGKISTCFQKYKIFEDIIEPCDIRQGYLGDCYFLAGLAALAERPDRIFQLFLLNQVNDMKYYSVKMIYRGKWRRIDLDQSIPIMNNQPAFSKSQSGELWVIVLQKAWAKLYGSYKQLQGGFPEEPLHDLTGAPIKYLFFQRLSPRGDEEWAYLLQASLREYAMVASSPPGTDSNQSASGIFQGHAYTFLNATQLQYNNKKQRIVQLRNPWGQGQFKGHWSDNDPIWNSVSESEKKRVNFKKNNNDGIFFMTFNDFIHQFRNIAIAQINDNASYVYESFIDRQSQGVFFAIRIKCGSQYSLQVDKTPERSYTGQMQQRYKYPEAWLELGKVQQQKIKKFQGYISKRRTLYRNYKLQPGLYIAWVKIDFDPTFQKQFQVNLAVYGEYACRIRLATREEAIKFTGNPSINWTGQKNTAQQKNYNKYIPSTRNQFEKNNLNSKNFSNIVDDNSSIKYPDSKILQKNKAKQKQRLEKEKKNLQLANLDSKNNVVSKADRKVRRIETQHTKIQTIQQNQDGQALIKTQDNQIRKQSVSIKGNIKTKSTQNKKQSVEVQYMGQTTSKRQKLIETIKLKQQKQDGKVIEKVSKKETQTQMFEEDDDGTGQSFISLGDTQPVSSLPYSKSKIHSGTQNNINSQNRQPNNSIKLTPSSHIQNSTHKKSQNSNTPLVNSIPAKSNNSSKQKIDDRVYNQSDFNDRNVIKYVDQDSEEEGNVKTSFIHLN